MQPLFRAEAVAHATQRLDGDVLLPAPLATWGAVVFVVAVLASAAWFAATATYTRTESLQGWLAPDGGVTRAVSHRDGIVRALLVAEGDVVEVGAPLARVGSPAHLGSGRDGLDLNPSQSNEGTYGGSAFEDVANGPVPDADTQAVPMPSEVAVQTLVAKAAQALLWDMAELSQHGFDGSSFRSVERDGNRIVAAPISGRVEALLAREGQYIARGSTVALVAVSDKLVAQIEVPSHVAGLVTSGQGLRLKYEELSVGLEGVQQGIVTHVSRRTPSADVPEHAAIPDNGPAYRAKVRLPAQEIDVGGMSVVLRAGMRVTAEIPACRRTLLQTLYETIR